MSQQAATEFGIPPKKVAALQKSNPSIHIHMQPALQKLLELLLVLLRLPKDAPQEAIDKAKQNLEDHKALIDTSHGDSELNHPDSLSVVDDLIEVAATSDPDEEYAETPADLVEQEEPEQEQEQEQEETSKAKSKKLLKKSK